MGPFCSLISSAESACDFLCSLSFRWFWRGRSTGRVIYQSFFSSFTWNMNWSARQAAIFSSFPFLLRFLRRQVGSTSTAVIHCELKPRSLERGRGRQWGDDVGGHGGDGGRHMTRELSCKVVFLVEIEGWTIIFLVNLTCSPHLMDSFDDDF